MLINSFNHLYLENLFVNLRFCFELIPISIAIFLIGLIGYLESNEFLSILINAEIMMLAINFNLITYSVLWKDYFGQVYALNILAMTAAETVIGLGILILSFRTKANITFDEYATLKG